MQENAKIEVKEKEKMEQTATVAVATKKGEVRTFKTNLVNKSEVFRLLALAEALSLPILLVGPPGVAKTACVLSYAEGYYGGHEEALAHSFILETDEGTKPSEVKGYPDMQKLLVENKFEKHAPIADARFIVINEVDKAAGGLRNALLGVMNEKIVFNGDKKTPCQWKVFVATCNVIPQEEEGNPFWDRFILKMEVSRMGVGDMMKYYRDGDKKHLEDVNLKIPTMAEIESVTIPENKLEQFLSKTREHCTDRTLTFVPKLVKAASIIYNTSIDRALIKVASIIAGNSVAQELGKILHTKEMKEIMDKATLIPGITDPDQLNEVIDKINILIETNHKAGKITEDDIREVQKVLMEVTKDHPVAQEVTFEELD